jgi:hypothetical protein
MVVRVQWFMDIIEPCGGLVAALWHDTHGKNTLARHAEIARRKTTHHVLYCYIWMRQFNNLKERAWITSGA